MQGEGVAPRAERETEPVDVMFGNGARLRFKSPREEEEREEEHSTPPQENSKSRHIRSFFFWSKITLSIPTDRSQVRLQPTSESKVLRVASALSTPNFCIRMSCLSSETVISEGKASP
jgi:hypothetical protein